MGVYVTPGTHGARWDHMMGPQIYIEATKGRNFKGTIQLLNYLYQRKKGSCRGHGLISERVVMTSHLKSL